MSYSPDTDVVKITTIDPDTGEEIDRPFFGVAVGDNMSYRITRSAETLDELRAQIGDLHDPRAIWEHALEHDEDDEDYLCFSPQEARQIRRALRAGRARLSGCATLDAAESPSSSDQG